MPPEESVTSQTTSATKSERKCDGVYQLLVNGFRGGVRIDGGGEANYANVSKATDYYCQGMIHSSTLSDLAVAIYIDVIAVSRAVRLATRGHYALVIVIREQPGGAFLERINGVERRG